MTRREQQLLLLCTLFYSRIKSKAHSQFFFHSIPRNSNIKILMTRWEPRTSPRPPPGHHPPLPRVRSTKTITDDTPHPAAACSSRGVQTANNNIKCRRRRRRRLISKFIFPPKLDECHLEASRNNGKSEEIEKGKNSRENRKQVLKQYTVVEISPNHNSHTNR